MNKPGITIAEFSRLYGPGNQVTKGEIAGKFAGGQLIDGVKFDDHEDFREFNDDIKKRRVTYLGLGDEATQCGRFAMVKSCENGHWFLKTLACGREWCPTCGEDGSEHHGRRISRLATRVFSMDTVGYFVFEMPVVLRPLFKDVEALREARRYLHRLLAREFPHNRGVSRWHFYGSALLTEHDADLQYHHYNPHLNVLIAHGFVGKKQLKRVRRLWSQWVYRYGDKKYYKKSPVYYKYHKAPGKKYHLIRYITRSTFKQLNDDNIGIARGLFAFNNTSWFGNFTEAEKAEGQKRYDEWLATLKPSKRRSVIEVAAHEAFNKDICPICHAPMVRLPGIDKVAEHEVRQEFGGGLYEVKQPGWSHSHVTSCDAIYGETLPEQLPAAFDTDVSPINWKVFVANCNLW